MIPRREEKLAELEARVTPETWEPFVERFGERGEEGLAYKGAPEKQDEGPQKGAKQASRRDLSWDEMKALQSINADPCLHLTARAERLGVAPAKMTRVKERLRNKGLIEQKRATLQGRSGTYHWLTEDGRRVIGQLGEKPRKMHGSLEHFCRILALERQYGKHYQTDTDKKVGEIRPDIWCVKRHEDRYESGVVEVIDSAHTRRDLGKVRTVVDRVDWIDLYFTSEHDRTHYRYTFQVELAPQRFEKLAFRMIG